MKRAAQHKEALKKALSVSRKFRSPIRSIGAKLFVTFVVSIIVFVFTVGMVSYSVSKQAIKDKVTESSFNTITQGAEKIDMLMRDYIQMTLQLMYDQNIAKLLTDVKNHEVGTYEMLQSSMQLEKALQAYTFSDSSVDNVYIIPLDTTKSSYTSSTGMVSNTAELIAGTWFKEAIAEQGRAVWTGTMPKGIDGLKSATFGIARLLTNASTMSSDYMLVLEVKLSALEPLLVGVDIGEGSTTQIIDRNGHYIYSSDRNLLTQYVPDWLLPNPVAATEDWSGTAEAVNESGDELLSVYQDIQANKWLLLSTVPVKELVKDANIILIVTFIIMLIAAVLAVVIGWLVMRMISKPLLTISGLMKEGAQGRLTVRAKVTSRDEIGELSTSFNEMMVQISSLVRKTEGSAKDVLDTASALSEASRSTAISAREIAVATEEIAKGATSLAVEAERGSDLTNHMAEQMRVVIDANELMDQSVHQVAHSSASGTSNMGALMERTESTGETLHALADRVKQLSDSAASIRKIMEVLNSMTKQTNILSLNATIEAARAGTAGKGFMVVADEIRNLADQSHRSINVVNQITERIQVEIVDTVNALSSIFPIFAEQEVAVKETDSIFGQVQFQMDGMIGSLDNVTGSINRLNDAQSTLVEAMGNVSAVAEQASATSQEVASLSGEQLNISTRLVELSQTLEEVSTQLKESLNHFRFE